MTPDRGGLTSAAMRDGMERIKVLAMAEAYVLARKGISRLERAARKAKIEAYTEALDALAEALREKEAQD